MGFDQYHEPTNELPQETRTFARMIASLTEEAEAIGWYEQRLEYECSRNVSHEAFKMCYKSGFTAFFTHFSAR